MASITLTVTNPEMARPNLFGGVTYCFDGATGKQISKAEYDRQTLLGIASALGAESVHFNDGTTITQAGLEASQPKKATQAEAQPQKKKQKKVNEFSLEDMLGK